MLIYNYNKNRPLQQIRAWSDTSFKCKLKKTSFWWHFIRSCSGCWHSTAMECWFCRCRFSANPGRYGYFHIPLGSWPSSDSSALISPTTTPAGIVRFFFWCPSASCTCTTSASLPGTAVQINMSTLGEICSTATRAVACPAGISTCESQIHLGAVIAQHYITTFYFNQVSWPCACPQRQCRISIYW